MRALDRDLTVASAATLVCAAVVVSVPTTAVRVLFAVPLCLLLPGYAITAASFARARLDGPQMLMLALALSLATLTIGALLLNFVPGGLRIDSWTVLLVVVVLAGCGVATRRRRPPVAAQPRRRRVRRPRPSEVVLLLVAGLTASSALVLSRIPLGARNAVGYTELWMLKSGTLQAPAVRIGVLSAERSPTTYRLRLQTNPGHSSVLDSNLTLRPGGGTQYNVPLALVQPSAPAFVAAQLYRSGSSSVYRQVTAVISPRPSAPVSLAAPPRRAAHAPRRGLHRRSARRRGHRTRRRT